MDSHGYDTFRVVSEASVPPRRANAEKSTGEVMRQDVLDAVRPSGLRGIVFSYRPGARSHWHIHEGEQALVVVRGRGLVQWRGLERPRELDVGDWVQVEPGVPHWHGAMPDSELVHLAVTASGGTEWLGPVGDELYASFEWDGDT